MTGAGDRTVVEVDVLVLRESEEDGADHGREAADLDSPETVVVVLTDAAGRTGIGEADAPAEAVRDLVLMADVHALSRGLSGVIVGRDPFGLAALNAEMYEATLYHGRRGLGVHALSAVDIALHDLVGHQLQRPVYDLLGGLRRDDARPYATLYAGPVGHRTLPEMVSALVDLAGRAVELGHRAIKAEVLFEDLCTDRELVTAVREVRQAIGPDVTMLVDFGYRWHDWRDALWTLNRLEDQDLWCAEATLQHDDLAGHARLAARVETRVCGAEFAATRHEIGEWITTGGVDVVQPDVGRCGGLTELVRIARTAEDAGVQVVPHGWNTGITAAASLHAQLALPNMPFVELAVPELQHGRLRPGLVGPHPQVVQGRVAPPTGPGLGVHLRDDVVARFRVPGRPDRLPVPDPPGGL